MVSIDADVEGAAGSAVEHAEIAAAKMSERTE